MDLFVLCVTQPIPSCSVYAGSNFRWSHFIFFNTLASSVTVRALKCSQSHHGPSRASTSWIPGHESDNTTDYLNCFARLCFHVCQFLLFVLACVQAFHLSWQTEQATLPPPVSSLPVGQRGPLRNAYGVANEACLMFRKWLANVHVNEVKLCYCKFCQVVVMWPHISQPELHRCSWSSLALQFGWSIGCALALQVLWPCGRAVWSATMLAPVRAIALLGWALGLRHAKRRPMARKKPDRKGWHDDEIWQGNVCVFLDVFGMSCFFLSAAKIWKKLQTWLLAVDGPLTESAYDQLYDDLRMGLITSLPFDPGILFPKVGSIWGLVVVPQVPLQQPKYIVHVICTLHYITLRCVTLHCIHYIHNYITKHYITFQYITAHTFHTYII